MKMDDSAFFKKNKIPVEFHYGIPSFRHNHKYDWPKPIIVLKQEYVCNWI